MTIWEYALLFLAVLLGGGAGLFIRRNQTAFLRLLLAFSGAYIFGIAALHLLPDIFAAAGRSTGLWLLLGFFTQMLLELLSRGVEHGHVHARPNAPTLFGLQILFGLCLHAFIEGLPLTGYPELHDHASAPADAGVNHLYYAVVLHKAPAAFALAILLVRSMFSRPFIAGSLLLFAAMSPLGALLGDRVIAGAAVFNGVMAAVVGSFLHISTTILFEGDDHAHQHVSWRRLLVIVAGFTMALLTSFEF